MLNMEYDSLVTELILKCTDVTSRTYAEICNVLDSKFFEKMQNPLILAEYLQRGFNHGNSKCQDFALESLVILIGKYGLEYVDYYKNLYDMIKERSTFSLKMLKILEISLKNSKITATTILPFMKLFLRKALYSNPLEICWFLSIIINLSKMNESLRTFYVEEGVFVDEYDLDLTFDEAKELSMAKLKAVEVLTLRK